MKKYVWYSVIAIFIVMALTMAYFHGTDTVSPSKSVEQISVEDSKPEEEPVMPSKEEPLKKEEFIPPAANNVPVEAEAEDTDELYCYLTVECGEILNNLNLLAEEKHVILPADGIIYPETKVLFNEGESVFHVLRREMKKAGIHFEFTMTPLFNSAYIEGINNLYEFDCGEQSGWLYSVNGKFPNYGSSSYMVKKGDKIRWQYTVSFGRDVGGYYLEGEEMVENDI